MYPFLLDAFQTNKRAWRAALYHALLIHLIYYWIYDIIMNIESNLESLYPFPDGIVIQDRLSAINMVAAYSSKARMSAVLFCGLTVP